MQIKSDRELFRRRRRGGGWILLLLIVVAASVYIGYNLWAEVIETSPIVGVPATPTPLPTPTPSPLLYIAEAEDAYWSGYISQAIVAYQQALDLEPNQTDIYIELARLLVLEGRPERGLVMAREALRRQPENARAWAALGISYEWLRALPEAQAAFQQAIALDPTQPEPYAYLAETYMARGNWFGANDALDTALKLNGSNVDVARNHGYVLESQGSYSAAIQVYRDAIAQHGEIAHLYLAIGRNALALGNFNLALEVYEQAVEADPYSATARDRLGWLLLLQGEYERAEEHLQEAIALDPTFGGAYGRLAILYFQRRNYEDAIDTFRPAIRYGEARTRRRTVFFVITAEDVGGIGDAPSNLEVARAEFVHPENPESPLRGIIRGSGEDSPVAGHVRLDVLSGRYQVSLTDMPPVPTGKVYVGWFLTMRSPERQIIRTEPIFPAPDGRVEMNGSTGAVAGPAIESYYTLALCYYLLNQCSDAIPYIEVALRIDPTDANAVRTWELCTR